VQNLVLQDTPFDIRTELRDPYHMDFRPCPKSKVAAMDVGAYRVWSTDTVDRAVAVGATNERAVGATNESYWIPGRRLFTSASTPIPPDAAIAVKTDLDLMFLPVSGLPSVASAYSAVDPYIA
jgi:hypothetical protein